MPSIRFLLFLICPIFVKRIAAQCIVTDSDIHHFVNQYIPGGGTIASQPSCSNNIETWDISRVTDLEFLFSSYTYFNSDISAWAVDKVTTLRGLFYRAESFNQDLGAWNVARVTDMSETFSLATNFSGIGIESWNVSAVEEFTDVFSPPNAMSNCTREAVYTNWSAQNYIFPIGGIYKVPPTGDCTPRCMISDLNELQSHVDEYADNGGEIMSNAACSHNIESWDISSVTEFTSLFSAASPRNFGVLSANLSRWNTSKVESMVDIFKDNTDIQIVGLEKWNTHSLVTLDGAFSGAANFNSDISLWNVRKVSNFRRAFASAREFNADIGSWNVDRAVNMYEMFQHAHAFNADLSCWSTRRVVQFQGMFHDAELFDARGIWVWNVSNGYDFFQMFDLADSVDNCTRFNIYDAWPQHFQFDYTSFGSYTSCAGEPLLLPRSACAPRGCVLTSATIQSEVRNWYELGHTHEECGDVIGSWDVSRVTDLSYIFSRPDFNSDISTWTVDNVTTLQNTFYQAETFNQNLSAWNVAKVTNMAHTFDFAWVFSGIGLENWNVSAVEDFNFVFTPNINGMTNCTRETVYTSWSAQNPNFPISATYAVPPAGVWGGCTPAITTTEATISTTDAPSPSPPSTTLTPSSSTTALPISSTTPAEDSANSSSSFFEVNTIIAAGGGFFFVAAILVVGCICWKRQRRAGGSGHGTRKASELELHQLRQRLEHQSAILESKDQEITMLSSAWVIKWSELKILDELAQGAYGKVFRGTLRGRFKVAIKLMFDSSDAPLDEDAEIRILQRARHPRLVMFFGCGKNDQHTFIVLEFMDRGSLEDLIQATHTASSSTLKSSFSWPIRLQLLHDVATGMLFLHNLHKGCIHRDLKSANILLAVENENEELRAKVADFGLSRFIDKGVKDEQYQRFKDMLVDSLSTESSNTSRDSVDQGEFSTDAGAGDEEEGFMKNLGTNSSVTMTCGAGTPVYMAPETWACMVRGSGVKHLSNKIDVYAFAVIMWEVLERQRPWSDINFTYKIKKRVMKGRRPPYSEKGHPDSRGSTEPRNFTKLLELCWDNDPHDRPTFATILDTMNPWLEKKNVSESPTGTSTKEANEVTTGQSGAGETRAGSRAS